MLLEKNSSKRASLAGYDILILTAIFWSVGIVSSTHAYIELIRGTATIDENLVFSAADNYIMLTQQGVCLAVAGIYLWFRRARRKILCKRFSTKSRMALENRADSGLDPLITESHGGQNGMCAGTA